MNSLEPESGAWGTIDSGSFQSERLRLPRSFQASVSRLRALGELLSQPAELWWTHHGKRVVRIAALLVGGVVFLAVAHIVLSLLSPPSGL